MRQDTNPSQGNPAATAHGNRTSRFLPREAQLHNSARGLSPVLRHGKWIGRPSFTDGHVVALYAYDTGRPTSALWLILGGNWRIRSTNNNVDIIRSMVEAKLKR
jgi:hypothetical protein